MKTVLFLFSELNDLDIEWLISQGKQDHIREGTVLITQGQQTDALFIVLEGLFAVRVAGTQEPIGTLGPGDVVGEMSFIDSRPPSSTVQATTRAVVYRVSRELLSRRLRDEAAFAARFYRALSLFLSHRLRRLTIMMSAGRQTTPQSDAADELDGQVLDSVYLAGKRFQRVFKGSLAA